MLLTKKQVGRRRAFRRAAEKMAPVIGMAFFIAAISEYPNEDISSRDKAAESAQSVHFLPLKR